MLPEFPVLPSVSAEFPVKDHVASKVWASVKDVEDGSTFTAPLVRTTIPAAPPAEPNFPPRMDTFDKVLWPDTAPMTTGFELAAVEVEALTPVVPKLSVMSPPLARY